MNDILRHLHLYLFFSRIFFKLAFPPCCLHFLFYLTSAYYVSLLSYSTSSVQCVLFCRVRSKHCSCQPQAVHHAAALWASPCAQQNSGACAATTLSPSSASGNHSSLERYFIWVLFYIEFLLWSCRSFLITVVFSHLLVTWFANILSHSINCCFFVFVMNTCHLHMCTHITLYFLFFTVSKPRQISVAGLWMTLLSCEYQFVRTWWAKGDRCFHCPSTVAQWVFLSTGSSIASESLTWVFRSRQWDLARYLLPGQLTRVSVPCRQSTGPSG